MISGNLRSAHEERVQLPGGAGQAIGCLQGVCGGTVQVSHKEPEEGGICDHEFIADSNHWWMESDKFLIADARTLLSCHLL